MDTDEHIITTVEQKIGKIRAYNSDCADDCTRELECLRQPPYLSLETFHRLKDNNVDINSFVADMKRFHTELLQGELAVVSEYLREYEQHGYSEDYPGNHHNQTVEQGERQ